MDTFISTEWDTYLDRFEQQDRDIYYTEGYVKLYDMEGGTPLCAICSDYDKVLLMPFIRKSIGDHYDFETPYGYGGPIANTKDKAWISDAVQNMMMLFAREGYLCGFYRFHPILNNASVCDGNGIEVLYDRKTVIMDLTADNEEIWNRQINSKCRNMIRRAEKSDLLFEIEESNTSFSDFVRIYNATMERHEAEDFYYFDGSYYDRFVSLLSENYFLGTVRHNGRLVCASLFMYYGDYGHYHLSGSDRDMKFPGVNNLMLWMAAKELKNRGVKKFHLGGGSNSDPDNSLYLFKSSFSKIWGDFFIGKSVFNRSEYEKVCIEWEKNNPEKVPVYGNRLLKYRY